MKKMFTLFALLITVLTITSCSKMRNRWKSEGGFFASMAGGTMEDYVVISQSGGEIMDCWKLKNVMVQSPETSDGWLFIDADGNSVYVGGDVKIIRCMGRVVFEDYHEYHMENESLSYRKKFSKSDKK
jgi:hypothetical protein